MKNKDEIEIYEQKIKEIDCILENNLESYIENIEKNLSSKDTPDIASKVFEKIEEEKVVKFENQKQKSKTVLLLQYIRVACIAMIFGMITYQASPYMTSINNREYIGQKLEEAHKSELEKIEKRIKQSNQKEFNFNIFRKKEK